MTLTGEEFEKAYREKFQARDGEVNQAEHVHAYIIKRPNYFPNDPRLEPKDKKVAIYPSCKITGGVVIVSRVFDLEGAVLTDSLKDADIGVYIGEYLCDFERRVNIGETGSPAIWPLLCAARDRDLPLAVITNGRLFYEYCSGKCPEDKFMHDLIGQNKKIHHIPMGWPYNRANPLS